MRMFMIAFAFIAPAAFATIDYSIAAGNTIAAKEVYAPQTSDEHGVKLTVTPQNIATEDGSWDFRVVLETHTRDLGEELVKSSVLIVEGRQYTPLAWDGAPPGGHHRKGVLRFGAISPLPPVVELRIHLMAEPLPRSFRWQVRQRIE